jgi:uncharacterized protein YecT (DUF1311 family)
MIAPVSAEDRLTVLSICSRDGSHVQQRLCLESKMKESLSELNRAQRDLMSKLNGIEEDKGLKQQAISAAQADAQSYIGYSGKHCESFASLAFGGNSQHDRRLACHIELNLIRARQVDAVASSLR